MRRLSRKFYLTGVKNLNVIILANNQKMLVYTDSDGKYFTPVEMLNPDGSVKYYHDKDDKEVFEQVYYEEYMYGGLIATYLRSKLDDTMYVSLLNAIPNSEVIPFLEQIKYENGKPFLYDDFKKFILEDGTINIDLKKNILEDGTIDIDLKKNIL